MQKLEVFGVNKLKGQIKISGSKNAALPILAATLLTNKKVYLKNLPNVKDIETMIKLLQSLGSKTKFKKKSPSYNQMNAYLTGFKKSKGKIICFLDSDDFFEKNKLRQIQKYFETNKETQIISDKPFIFYNQKKNYKMKMF